MIDWAHAWPAITAAFLASLVEFVEALTIVLAVGTVRGWKHAMTGTFAGVVFLVVLVLLFGPSLHLVPLDKLQIIIGVLLCLFGMRWLRKAVLRSAGIIGMHDEDAIYKKQTSKLSTAEMSESNGLDWLAAFTTFKAVTIEGLEVVFIVIATGAMPQSGHTGSLLIPASIGAAVAGVAVIILGLIVHKPLSRVPENTLKYAVGVMLSAFGVFWVGEGLKFPWPGEDLSLAALAVGFLVVGYIGTMLARKVATSKQNVVPEVAV